ncbi:alpha/beta fold hydrolase [Inquilinus sp. CAU 1745]|uniref:alpha/beta fold hydrolase n=1 Tax=Inquilinus sp. CAU 1745 TaxID=3140369 RepID=UPI00325BA28A
MKRQGPRPLGLHLTAAQATWTTSLAALPLLRSGLPPWKPDGRLSDLAPSLAAADPADLAQAVERAVRRRSDAFLTGLERYRAHPYRRALDDPPVLWREGGSRLLDYGPPDGRPVLFVPSLINRGYILDLSQPRSLLRFLSRRGLRPMLLDWGEPGTEEQRFDLTDYVAGRLDRALDQAVAETGGPVPVAGYCMGGTLAVALAQRRPREVSVLALMAAPWDFHAAGEGAARRLAALAAPWRPFLSAWGSLPVDALQALFLSLDPLLAARKFARFAAMDPESEAAESFVALEDWLNDGMALAAPVAEECLVDWYGGNTPAMGDWRIAGEPVLPGRVGCPSLHLIPARDRIVPPESARALAEAMAGSEILAPPLGHIGMVVSAAAREAVWEPLAAWLSGGRDKSERPVAPRRRRAVSSEG